MNTINFSTPKFDQIHNAVVHEENAGKKISGKAGTEKGDVQLYNRTGKRSILQKIQHFKVERKQTSKLLNAALDEVKNDKTIWNTGAGQTAFMQLRKLAKKNPHYLKADTIRPHLVTLWSLREGALRAEENANANAAHLEEFPAKTTSPAEIFASKFPTSEDHKSDLSRFAEVDGGKWAQSTLTKLTSYLGLSENDECLAKFKAFVGDQLNAGPGVIKGVNAHVLEFSRRWSLAMRDDVKPAEIFGWGEAISEVVDALVAAYPELTTNEPTIAYLPELMAHDSVAALCELIFTDIKGDSVDMPSVAALGEQIAKEFLAAPKYVQMAFMASDGQKLMAGLKEALIAQPPGFDPTLTAEETQKLQKILGQAFDSALLKMPDQVLEMGTIEYVPIGQTKSEKRDYVKRLKLDGVAYRHEKPLAQGGFGFVDLYVQTGNDDQPKYIVLKTAKPMAELMDVKNEINMHITAETRGSNNVIGIKGTLRMPKGEPAIALEFAPHGTIADLATNYAAQKVSADEKIDSDLEKLTVIKDILLATDGLHTMHVAHQDPKTYNLLIDENGIIKWSDLGTSQLGSNFVRTPQDDEIKLPIDNVIWRAPEIEQRAENVIGQFSKFRKVALSELTRHDEIIAKAKKREKGRAKNDTIAFAEKNIEEIQKIFKEEKTKFALKADAYAADNWAVGHIAYELIMGKQPFDATFFSGILDMKKAFQNMGPLVREAYLFGGNLYGTDEEDVKLQNEIKAMSVADWEALKKWLPIKEKVYPFGNTVDGIEKLSEFKKLVVGLLDPDPAMRPDLADLARSALFSDLRIGSPEMRDRIKQSAEPQLG